MRKIFSLFLVYLAFPAISFCEEASHGAHGGVHHAEHHIGELWFHFINFSLYVLLLYLVLRSPITSGWRKRREAIAASLAKGTSILSDAKKELKDAEARFASIASDSEQIKKQMAKETEDEISNILQDAEKRAKDILRRGQESAAAEKKIVERVIREELSASVLKKAEEILSKKTSKESDRLRREASIKNIRQIAQ